MHCLYIQEGRNWMWYDVIVYASDPRYLALEIGCDIRDRKYVGHSKINVSLLVIKCGSLRCDILFKKSEQTLSLYMMRDIVRASGYSNCTRVAIL